MTDDRVLFEVIFYVPVTQETMLERGELSSAADPRPIVIIRHEHFEQTHQHGAQDHEAHREN
jgi:hypothetical protein